MGNSDISEQLNILKNRLHGELFFDDLMRSIYATDASVYRTLPLAVAYPKNEVDIKLLIAFAKDSKTSLIPRTAGTSLAGQCVGEGIVVDVSKYFTKILIVDKSEQTVTVQPGVVRDELNNYLKSFGLFFGPNTSTSNRCMIGGMVGNNSSGTTSIKYGVTRDKVLEIKTILSDGNNAVFNAISSEEFKQKMKLDNLEGRTYKTIHDELVSKEVQNRIHAEFPKPEIHRRNTGYAIDALIKSDVFSSSREDFNMCQLLTGSEGTLAFTTEITLQLDALPSSESIMVAAHFDSIEKCLNVVEIVMKHDLFTCEMMDKTILDCTKFNKLQQTNRYFIEGDPAAILMCEIKAESVVEAELQVENLLKDIRLSNLSYAHPKLIGQNIDKAMQLRNAGLGLLGNIIGDKKSVACIEDTAVALPDLANYINEFTQLMKKHNQDAIYYAHAGAGELHLRPTLNLKKSDDVALFRTLTTKVANLVKKYKGSFSGEHGDGIVRGECIPLMIGVENYGILKRIKNAFDPDNIFNPGKIVDVLPMDESLRYVADRIEPKIDTILDFSSSLGILREAEKCNGSGDCRKLPEFGGTMCPSFRATKNEKDTTRARANALREFLTHSEKPNKFNHQELKDVFDLCLSCKACSTECPSSVDIASLKAEFQYQYQQSNGIPLRAKLFAYHNRLNAFGSKIPLLTNALFSNRITSSILKYALGIAKQRHIPNISNISLYNYIQNNLNQIVSSNYIKSVHLFVDEFSNLLDTQIGIDAIELLTTLNYKICYLKHEESGRAFISKGLLEQARDIANKNIEIFKDIVSKETPLIGIEPSAIFTFKDEYLKLADDKDSAKHISKHTFLIEEFLQQEIELGNITAAQFTKHPKTIKFHGHCYQKALSNQTSSFSVLNLPENYKVTIIPSGCCGMAGSFGYEKEHYDISMKIGEQNLFPKIRKASSDTLIAANGTSCRHQLKDGTQKEALHPITILRRALL